MHFIGTDCPTDLVSQAAVRQNGLFWSFSLCLSRACLGKELHLIYEWLKKPGFSPVRADEFALVEVTRRLRAWPGQAAR